MGKLLNFKASSANEQAEMSDKGLVAKYQAQDDMNCVVIIMKRYAVPITAIAYRYLKNEEAVKDLSGDLFLKLTDKLKKLSIEEIGSFKAWLLTVVKNTILDLIRKNQTRSQHYLGYGQKTETVENNEIAEIKKMDNEQLYRVIDQLPDGEKNCIQEIYFEGCAYQDIMDRHNWTFNQVRGFRERAIKRLKGMLGSNFEDYFKDF